MDWGKGRELENDAVSCTNRVPTQMISLDLAVNAIVAGLLLGGFYAAVTVGVTISFSTRGYSRS
jgi:hypothetical protein